MKDDRPTRESHFTSTSLDADDAAPPALSPEGQWRAEYRNAHRQRRVAGLQLDMFGAPATTHFHRNPQAPMPDDWPFDYEMTRFQDLTSDEQARGRVENPMTPWAISTRRRLTPEETAAVIAGAANWLRLGQRVRIISATPSIDGKKERQVGRTGVIWRTCGSVFADYVHVNLDLVGQERSEKIVFLELRDVMPIDD